MKKAIALFVAGLFLFSTACSNKTTNQDKKINSQVATSADQPKEKVKFSATFLSNEWHGNPNEMEVFKKLEEKANVTVEWQIYPNATWADKKNVLIAGGDLPDVFYMNALNNNDVSKYSSQGLILPLDDLINKYSPKLKAVFEKMPQYKRVCINQDDGKIYHIARAAERTVQYTAGLYYINKVWLDKLNLKIPTTTDQFYEVLKAFKTKDPNGNGKADEIPFTFASPAYTKTSTISNCYLDLFGPFGYIDTPDHFVRDENGKIVYVANKPEYKEAIKFYSKFFAEGLMDAEGFTANDSKLMNSKGNNPEPILGSFPAFDATFVVPKDRVNDYAILPPLKGPSGKQVYTYNEASNGNINGTQFMITNKSKGKEEGIMRWLDSHFDATTSIELFLGTVGKNIKKGANDMLEYIDTPSGMSYSEFRYKNAPVHVPCVIPGEDWGKTIAVMQEDVYKLKIANETYKPFQKQSYIFQLPNLEESKFKLTKGKDIDDLVVKNQVKWLSDGTIDKEWDEYVKKLDSMGLPEYIKIVENIDKRINKK